MLLLLASFCLRRHWSICHGLVCGWVAAPAVAVQPNPGVTSSVAVTADVVCTWLQWLLMLPSAICTLSSLSQWCSLLLTHLDACLDIWPPTAVVWNYSFPACWIDVACLQILFTDVFEAQNRPSCRSGISGKLTIQHVHGDSAILHVADMTKTAQVPLGKQRQTCLVFLPESGHSCLGHGPARWCPKSFWSSAGGKTLSLCILGRSTESMPHYHRAVYWEHRAWYTFILVLVVSMEFFQALFARQAIAFAALPIHVFSLASRERLLEMVEPR